MPRSGAARRRALIVNCYADQTRRPVGRAWKIPQTLGPVFLAGGLAPALWDIRLHNEHSHGPLEDPDLLGWPDLLVLTGMLTGLDRMRQVTAYARSRNPAVIVVGGGHITRAFPSYCDTFLDYVCQGDVEQLGDLVAELFGREYAADEWLPRYDLAHYLGPVGYAETTRYCNFGCTFCTLTGEHRPYASRSPDQLRRELRAVGRRKLMVFNDNNFFGNDRRSFAARVQCIGESWRAGQFDGWCALVTNDFFLNADNVRLVRDAGCVALFSGVESFDTSWSARQNKRQNTVRPPADLIRETLAQDMVFTYGLIADLTTRTIAEVRREIELILDTPEITLPAYISLPIPIPGTPFFYTCLDQGLILPRTKVRDLDATTISMRTVDPVPAAAAFARDLQAMRGYRLRVADHSRRFWLKYRKRLTAMQFLLALGNDALLLAPLLGTGPRRIGRLKARRTHVSTTEPLDRFYQPAFPVAREYEHLFAPTMLTDDAGEIARPLIEDVERKRPRERLVELVPAAAHITA